MKATKSILAALTISTIAAGTASAVPVQGLYQETNHCDVLPNQTLTHELGDASTFPLNEAILVNVVATPHQTVCVPDDGTANDWNIRITNISGIAWQNLFFVGDIGTSVGNHDGVVMDIVNAPGAVSHAFRIDGLVTVTGMNDNLFSESSLVDEIFSPGEVWDFNVSNFTDAFGLASPPLFLTPGVFAGSSPPQPGNQSNASILADPIPEPAAMSVLLIVGTLLMRRQRIGKNYGKSMKDFVPSV